MSARTLIDGCLLRASAAHAGGDHGEVLDACREALPAMPEYLRECIMDKYGMPTQYPVFDYLLRLTPIVLDDATTDEVGRIARGIDALRTYRVDTVVARGCLARVNSVYARIASHPGILESAIVVDWPYAAEVLSIASALGIVSRNHSGTTYALEMRSNPEGRRPLR